MGDLGMMGELPDAQGELIYDFNLEKHIPAEHLLRQIDQFLDFTELRRHLKAYYSTTGRPSVDPELMMRMLIIGYCYGIRSERRLCEEVHFNLVYRWFCPSGWKVKCRTTRRSRRTDTVDSVTARRFVLSSSRSCHDVLMRAWWVRRFRD